MKNGSSLILVLLVIAGVVSTIMITERVAIIQSSQLQTTTDDTFAYNAAKAGIEDGLLRYRYNRNVETQLNDVYRYDLTTGVAAKDNNQTGNYPNDGEVASSTPLSRSSFSGGYKASDEYYDLQISYKSSSINVNKSGQPIDPANNIADIPNGSSVTLTGFANSVESDSLKYAFFTYGTCSSNLPSSVQVQVLNVSGAPGETNIPVATGQHPTSLSSIGIDISNAQSVTLLSIGCDVHFALESINNNTGGSGQPFDGLTTTITSTGYYGNAKRTFVATIDRTTGALLGVYDFTAYAGNNIQVSP